MNHRFAASFAKTAFAAFVLLTLLFQGCSTSNSKKCDPEVDEDCVCRLKDAPEVIVNDCIAGATDDGDACKCRTEEEDDPNNDPDKVCSDDFDCDEGQFCEGASGNCQAGCIEGGCADGLFCDLQTRVCAEPADPSCADGILNQDETDVDCGGSCEGCGSGAACNSAADCFGEGLCNAGVCDLLPTIRSKTPSSGATNVESDTVTIEFSESIDPASININTFRVNRTGERGSLPGSTSVNGRTLTFKADSPFADNITEFEVVLAPCGSCGSGSAITDLTGNPIPADAGFKFSTLPIFPGNVYLASTRDSRGGDRVSFGPGQNAEVVANSEGALWNMRHLGGGRYNFRGANFNLELAMASGPGGTFDVGRGGSEWRNAIFANSGTALRITPRLIGGDIYYNITTDDGFGLQLACPAGFCTPANLQFKKGGEADNWYIIR